MTSTSTSTRTTPILDVKQLEGGYGSVQILNSIDLRVYEGEFVTIIGPNGSGKSTFLKMLFGIAYEPQVDNIFPSLTVRENMQMGGIRLSAGKLTDGIGRVCWTFPDLESKISDLAATLSGGERQMLAISRALISSPSFLLLDEPTAALSPLYQQQIMSCIDGLRSEGMTVLLVEQNARLSLARSDRGYIFSGGKVVHTGIASEILDDPDIGAYFLGMQAD